MYDTVKMRTLIAGLLALGASTEQVSGYEAVPYVTG